MKLSIDFINYFNLLIKYLKFKILPEEQFFVENKIKSLDSKLFKIIKYLAKNKLIIIAILA